MSSPIRSVAVLGAGVMGSGIAAHMANAGIPTLLLDIVPPTLSDAEKKDRAARNRFATAGVDKALKSRPPAFVHASRQALITTGNLEDDLGMLAHCDLVIEVVLERMEVKRALLEKLEKVVSAKTIVSSNTSGLSIAGMLEGRALEFRRRFLVTHFFNPPRYMKLLELVAGPDTDPQVFARIKRFGEDVLGKGIVIGKDTPNFVGNRIGAYSMMDAIHQMLEFGLTPEDVDAIVGEPLLRPKSAAFRTADVVGVDTFVQVADNCYAALVRDEEREVFAIPPYLRQMIEKKQFGDKTKGGFYRKGAAGIETLDPKTGEYRSKKTTEAVDAALKALKSVKNPKEKVKKLMADPGPAGQFAWKVTSRVLCYAAKRMGEIADDVTAIDDAMKWGYNWSMGPFELWDALGFAEVVQRMEADKLAVPASIKKMRDLGATGFYKNGQAWHLETQSYVPCPVDPRRAPLEVLRKGSGPILKTDGGSLWDLGDDVFGVTLATKGNTLDPDVITLLNQSVERAESDARALVVFNQGDHFSIGANLFLVVMAAGQKDWEKIHSIVSAFQAAGQRMKYASIPIVCAPYGMTLGGGLEMCLGATAVQASIDTFAGLVEVGVGLIPGGGGNLNLLWRAFEGLPEGTRVDSYAIVTQVFLNIALAKASVSADDAKALGYFRGSDGVTFDRSRHLHDTKARAIGLAEAGYHRPAPRSHVLPGESGMATLKMMVKTMQQAGQASAHDALIASKLATVLCGGVDGHVAPVTEEKLLELECEAFVSLCGEPKSQERMQYMLTNNKPLRN